MNDEIRLLIKQKKLIYRTQRKNNDFDIGILSKLSEDLINAIINSKLAYHRRIASNLMTPTKHLKLIGPF